MKDPTTAPTNPALSRRGFLSSGALAVLSLAAPPLRTVETPKKGKIEIPVFDEEQFRSNVLHYNKYGWEPPLAVILSVLISQQNAAAAIGSLGRDTMKSFFSVTRVRRILEYAKSEDADPRVLVALQKELNLKGWWGSTTPFWIGLSAWFKVRIIDSFDQSRFRVSRIQMIVKGQPKIEQLLKWPLRELE